MKKKNIDTIIDIPTYRKYWVYDKPYGHDIVIAADTGKYTIKCKWPDLERGNNGRVSRSDRDRGTNPATGVSLDLSDNARASDDARISRGASSNAQGSPEDIDEEHEYAKKLSKFYKGE